MAKALLVASLAATLAAGGLVSHGLATDGRVTACAKEENGQLRLVEAEDACLTSETPVSWSVGTGGGASFTTVTAAVAAAPGLVTATAICPTGARAVGGGAHADPVSGGNVLADYPAGDGAWTASAALNPAAVSFVVYAVCATSA